MPSVATVVTSEANGAPQVAWGDTFFYFEPDPAAPHDRRMPFATIVQSDYEGFDVLSDLARPGVLRLNIGVGRDPQPGPADRRSDPRVARRSARPRPPQ
jgi:hypothetical protein